MVKGFLLPFLLIVPVLFIPGNSRALEAGGEVPSGDMVADSAASNPTSVDSMVPGKPVAREIVEEERDPVDADEEVPERDEVIRVEGGLLSDIARFFRDGGPAMWAILVLFAVGVAISMERFIFLFMVANINPTKFMGRVAELIRRGSIEGAIASCADKNAPIARIIEAALLNYRNTERDIQNAVDEMALAELPRLHARTGYLATLANVSTMVGLLGTIFGLITAFEAVGAADPAAKSVMLSNGISMAMSTTAFGLIAAIPLLLAHSVLTAKADRLVDDIDRYSVMVINMLAQARKGN